MFSLSSLALSAVSAALFFTAPTTASPITPTPTPVPDPSFNLDFSKGNGVNYYTVADQTDSIGVKRCGVGVFTGGPIHSGTYVDLNNPADTHQSTFPSFGSDTGLSWSFTSLYTADQAWERLFDCGVSQDNYQLDFTRYSTSNNLLVEDTDAHPRETSVQDQTGTSYPLNLWQSYGVSITPDLTIKIYVDGVVRAIGTNQAPVTLVDRPQCYLGFSLAELLPNRPDQRAQGFIDRFAFWDSVLTDAQFLSLANYDDSCSPTYQNPTPPPSGAKGDPQFTGFMGQSYQVHGASDAFYNILSTQNLSYNAHFSYLESGSCRKGTQCFSHPGNYFSEVALMIRDAENKLSNVKAVAGPVASGMKVFINDASFALNTPVTIGLYTFTLESVFDLLVSSSEFNIRISNSDMFLNQDISIGEGLMKAIFAFKSASKSGNSTAADEIEATLPHGILGQTWSSKTHNNRWKHVAGQLFDYQLDSLNSTEFKFSRF